DEFRRDCLSACVVADTAVVDHGGRLVVGLGPRGSGADDVHPRGGGGGRQQVDQSAAEAAAQSGGDQRRRDQEVVGLCFAGLAGATAGDAARLAGRLSAGGLSSGLGWFLRAGGSSPAGGCW